jgi:DNA-binding response OmpR family regulator
VTTTRTTNATVLVCDDDPSTRGLVRATLERPGVTVVEAQGVDDLLQSARAANPDVLILDVRLGDDDGLDTLEALRDEGVLDGVPTVVVSVFADTATRSRATAAGVRVFVPKPFSPGRLQAIVEELLQAR